MELSQIVRKALSKAHILTLMPASRSNLLLVSKDDRAGKDPPSLFPLVGTEQRPRCIELETFFLL